MTGQREPLVCRIVDRDEPVIHATGRHLAQFRDGTRLRCLCGAMIEIRPSPPERVTKRHRYCGPCAISYGVFTDAFRLDATWPYPSWLRELASLPPHSPETSSALPPEARPS